jgi:hypothetical protein
MAVIRVYDRDYERLQALAEPFRDTPASVVARLLDEYERRHRVTLVEVPVRREAVESPGYLLLGQRDWLQFHQRDSIGSTAFYCRGAGAAMRNVPIGGVIACAQTGEVPHRVHLRGAFGGWEVLAHDDAWRRYGKRLGAPDVAAWRALVARIDSISHSGRVGLIRIDDVFAPQVPVALHPLGIALLRGSIKGRRLAPAEVAAIIGAER